MIHEHKKFWASEWRQSSLPIILVSKYDFPPDQWKFYWNIDINGWWISSQQLQILYVGNKYFTSILLPCFSAWYAEEKWWPRLIKPKTQKLGISRFW